MSEWVSELGDIVFDPDIGWGVVCYHGRSFFHVEFFDEIPSHRRYSSQSDSRRIQYMLQNYLRRAETKGWNASEHLHTLISNAQGKLHYHPAILL